MLYRGQHLHFGSTRSHFHYILLRLRFTSSSLTSVFVRDEQNFEDISLFTHTRKKNLKQIRRGLFYVHTQLPVDLPPRMLASIEIHIVFNPLQIIILILNASYKKFFQLEKLKKILVAVACCVLRHFSRPYGCPL